jgi:hypothetical protein
MGFGFNGISHCKLLAKGRGKMAGLLTQNHIEWSCAEELLQREDMA